MGAQPVQVQAAAAKLYNKLILMSVPNKFNIRPPSFSGFNAADKALIIFIKNPEAGKVKTRLAKDVGKKNALEIYKKLLEHTRNIASAVNASRLLFYDERIFLKDDWTEELFLKFVQTGHHLGEKMLTAFKKAFSLGNKRVVIIGSDCMELTEDTIKQAFEQLKSNDFVLGPAKDGGYYLLGMKFLEEKLFLNKNWSTQNVAKDTLNDIFDLQKSCFLLAELSDVDTVDDLNEELKALISPK